MTKETKDKFMYGLATITITYAFLFLTMLLFFEIPDKNKDIIMILSGQLVVASSAAIYTYFFGSTKGSADKTEMIANSIPIKKDITEEITN